MSNTLTEDKDNAVLNAELTFRARLHLPNMAQAAATDPHTCAAAIIMRAPWLAKTFGNVENLMPSAASLHTDTRETCYEKMIYLLNEHNESVAAAKSTMYSADEISARENMCQVRAQLLLKWALLYDISEGPNVMFKYITLRDRYNATERKHLTVVTYTLSHALVTTGLQCIAI